MGATFGCVSSEGYSTRWEPTAVTGRVVKGAAASSLLNSSSRSIAIDATSSSAHPPTSAQHLTTTLSTVEHLRQSAVDFANELQNSGEGESSVSKVVLLTMRVPPRKKEEPRLQTLLGEKEEEESDPSRKLGEKEEKSDPHQMLGQKEEERDPQQKLGQKKEENELQETLCGEKEERESDNKAAEEYFSVPIHCVKIPGINCFKSQSLLSKEDCDKIKDASLRVGIEEGYGSYRYAKQTLHCNEHESLKHLVTGITQMSNLITNKLFDDEADWGKGIFTLTKVDEPHIVVYDTTKPMLKSSAFFVEVEYHTDNSTVTWIIALSDHTEFRGGGTFFEEGARMVNLKQGQCIFFPGGSLRHRGEAITLGRRFLLVGFLDKKPHHDSESRPASA